MCMCVCFRMYVHRDQKKPSDPMDLELQSIVSKDVDSENQTQVLCKNSMHS